MAIGGLDIGSTGAKITVLSYRVFCYTGGIMSIL